MFVVFCHTSSSTAAPSRSEVMKYVHSDSNIICTQTTPWVGLLSDEYHRNCNVLSEINTYLQLGKICWAREEEWITSSQVIAVFKPLLCYEMVSVT
jgi:hypothetical protein